jgi:putative NIF3 family GTP cyclohydrolase 1 type 2
MMMNRKEFIKLTALAGGIYTAAGIIKCRTLSGAVSSPDISAAELQQFLVSLTRLGPKTVDRIIIGDPQTKARKIGTCWMPYWETCKKAVKAGVNILVTHEPTFYTHWDLDEEQEDYYKSSDYTKKQYLELVGEKKKWILENGLVIIRNHDTIDALKDRGIPFALGQFLGYGNEHIIASRTYYNVYKIDNQPASQVTSAIAQKLLEIGQPGIAFYGDPDFPVSSVGIGTGCICDPMEFGDLRPDIFIAIDDVVRTWTQTAFAADSGRPLIIINHGTSEEMGIRMLNQIIKERFPEIETIHFNQGCTYKWITG